MSARGFITHAFGSAAEMREFVLSEIKADQSVGFGGSMTVYSDLDLYNALKDRGNAVYYHSVAPAEERHEVIKKAHNADIYLMSCNAVTGDGEMLNIDGRGNRVAAMINGPRTVFFLAGENKFVADRDAAVERVKTVACPKNARRLCLPTPCARLGRCTDCAMKERMCNFTVWTDHVPANRTFHICVAPETLGY